MSSSDDTNNIFSNPDVSKSREKVLEKYSDSSLYFLINGSL